MFRAVSLQFTAWPAGGLRSASEQFDDANLGRNLASTLSVRCERVRRVFRILFKVSKLSDVGLDYSAQDLLHRRHQTVPILRGAHLSHVPCLLYGPTRSHLNLFGRPWTLPAKRSVGRAYKIGRYKRPSSAVLKFFPTNAHSTATHLHRRPHPQEHRPSYSARLFARLYKLGLSCSRPPLQCYHHPGRPRDEKPPGIHRLPRDITLARDIHQKVGSARELSSHDQYP
ncbi:hypothetical protein NM688_g6290 [Phlebia brevispora]|uniref:Uncharacterized protein n=1 Tax=Phlebia brevispora TaxID=194682 RepID=A0ACC1SHM6_9APHY|nr:hypothetical protein NM688_g6290 [Phlebia brevispora]